MKIKSKKQFKQEIDTANTPGGSDRIPPGVATEYPRGYEPLTPGGIDLLPPGVSSHATAIGIGGNGWNWLQRQDGHFGEPGVFALTFLRFKLFEATRLDAGLSEADDVWRDT